MRQGIGITRRVFSRVAATYRRRWGLGLCAVRPDGSVVYAANAAQFTGRQHRPARAVAVAEALRWGEPAVGPAPRETVIWAVPLMLNARLTGGLVCGVSEACLFRHGLDHPAVDTKAACSDLRRLAEEHNLTNAALLEQRRREYQREQVRAEAIHSYKSHPQDDIRAMYLLEEPMLIAAIRSGDRGQARAILNRLLVGMIHRAGRRLELVKSFFMELVAMMSRTAVEAGAPPQELLGANYGNIAELGAIHDEERLAQWLHEMLERIMDAIQHGRVRPPQLMLARALAFMNNNCGRDISRDEAAQAACMSGSHFSRMFRKHVGRTFGDMLNQMRADRAAELLSRSTKPIKTIAGECGSPTRATSRRSSGGCIA